jgi:hypothetical protein
MHYICRLYSPFKERRQSTHVNKYACGHLLQVQAQVACVHAASLARFKQIGAMGFSLSRPKDKYAASQSRAPHLHALPTITAFGLEHLVGYTTMSTKCSPDEKPVV